MTKALLIHSWRWSALAALCGILYLLPQVSNAATIYSSATLSGAIVVPVSSGDAVEITAVTNLTSHCGRTGGADSPLVVALVANSSQLGASTTLQNATQSTAVSSSGECSTAMIYSYAATQTDTLTVLQTSSGTTPTTAYLSAVVIPASSGGGGSTGTTTVSVDLTPVTWSLGAMIFLAYMWFMLWYFMPKTKRHG